jgi:hypothetical protein
LSPAGYNISSIRVFSEYLFAIIFRSIWFSWDPSNHDPDTEVVMGHFKFKRVSIRDIKKRHTRAKIHLTQQEKRFV